VDKVDDAEVVRVEVFVDEAEVDCVERTHKKS
jgi:hypothetical protein